MAINHYLTLYEGLKIFRDDMLSSIIEKLEAAYGDHWWEQGIARCLTQKEIERLRRLFEKDRDSLVVERPGEELAEMLDINQFGNIIEGNWKPVFRQVFGDRKVISWLHELREARNAVAHPQTGDLRPDDVWRGLDNAERILRTVNPDAAAEIRRLKSSVFRTAPEETRTTGDTTISEPWSGKKTASEIIYETVQKLLEQPGKDTFRPSEAYHEILKTHPDFNRGTNNGQITANCVNHPSRQHHSGRKPDRYFRVGRGVYRLYDQQRDGVWDQEGNLASNSHYGFGLDNCHN